MTIATDPLQPSIDDPQSILDIEATDLCGPDAILNDPPPPYPSRDRRPRTSPRLARRIFVHRIQTSHHQQSSSDEPISPISPDPHADEGFVEPTERTLLLPPAISRRVGGRPRSYSHSSATSAAPSLAQNVFSLFQAEDELDTTDDQEDGSYLSPRLDQGIAPDAGSRRRTGFFSLATWRRYFMPMGRKVYYSSLLHLMVINFPYALFAWVYLFVFTVVSL